MPSAWLVQLAVLHALGGATPALPVEQTQPCDEFHQALLIVPHVALSRRVGVLEGLLRDQGAQGCEVAFETNDSTLGSAVVPDFMADPGNGTYEAGWRVIPEMVADGPGSGSFGIRRGPILCLVRWEQPSYIDDDGGFVQSETFTMLIQCASVLTP